MLWLLENVPAVKKAAEENRLAFGTVDSWLIFHLTGGSSSRGNRDREGNPTSSSSPPPSDNENFVTDVTNASRTGLMCLRTRSWHPGTCAKLGIDVGWLPRIASSAETYGRVVAPPASSENISEMVRDKASEMAGMASEKTSDAAQQAKASAEEAAAKAKDAAGYAKEQTASELEQQKHEAAASVEQGKQDLRK